METRLHVRKKGRSVRSFLHVRAVDDIIDAIFDVLKSYATFVDIRKH